MAAMANGGSVTTIEGLARPDGTLHPMQQAFIDHDAFQCSYCTPGPVLVYGGFRLCNQRGLTFRMAQTPVQHYLPKLLTLVEERKIDPSFVITDRAPLEEGRVSTRSFATRRTGAPRL